MVPYAQPGPLVPHKKTKRGNKAGQRVQQDRLHAAQAAQRARLLPPPPRATGPAAVVKRETTSPSAKNISTDTEAANTEHAPQIHSHRIYLSLNPGGLSLQNQSLCRLPEPLAQRISSELRAWVRLRGPKWAELGPREPAQWWTEFGLPKPARWTPRPVVCVRQHLERLPTVWDREEGQYACRDCVVGFRPCFRWSAGGFMLLPLHADDLAKIGKGFVEHSLSKWIMGVSD